MSWVLARCRGQDASPPLKVTVCTRPLPGANSLQATAPWMLQSWGLAPTGPSLPEQGGEGGEASPWRLLRSQASPMGTCFFSKPVPQRSRPPLPQRPLRSRGGRPHHRKAEAAGRLPPVLSLVSVPSAFGRAAQRVSRGPSPASTPSGCVTSGKSLAFSNPPCLHP